MRHQYRSQNIHSYKFDSKDKIQSLYQQFQTLKKRIVISQRKKSHQKSQQQQHQKNQSIQLPGSRKQVNAVKEYQVHQKDYMQIQTKNALKAQVSRFFMESVARIQTKYQSKTAKLEQRLMCLNQLLPQLSKVINLSVKEKTQKRRQFANSNKNCICMQNQRDSYLKAIQIEERYSQKIRKMSQAYDGKISVLMNEIKDKATTSSTNKQHQSERAMTKKLQLEIRSLQQKMMSVESSLNSYQIECSKLRQKISKTERTLKDKDLLICQLSTQFDDKKLEVQNLIGKIEELTHQNLKIKTLEKQIKVLKSTSLSVERIKKNQNQWIQKLTDAQNKIIALDQQIIVKDLNITKAERQIQLMQKRINSLIADKTQKQQVIKDLTKISNESKFIEKTLTDLRLENQRLRSQLERHIDDKVKPIEVRKQKKHESKPLREQIQGHLSQKGSTVQYLEEPSQLLHRKNESLRHSHLVLPSQRKQLQKDLKIKQLQSQIILLYQENRLLKTKKDRFEDQVKGSQQDQEKFQQQYQILKDEIKRLHTDVRILDQCSVNLIKGKQISNQQIQKLDNSLKFAIQYRNIKGNKIK